LFPRFLIHDRDSIYFAAWDKLTDPGVRLHFPQGDLHVRKAVRVAIIKGQQTLTTVKPEG
jgi:hypothetical protein